MKYTPERWVILNIKHIDHTYQCVFAGWYGGYLNGDSWRFSSKIERIEEFEDKFVFHNYTGSKYECFKAAYGASGFMSAVFGNVDAQAQKEGVEIELSSEFNDRQDEFFKHKNVKAFELN